MFDWQAHYRKESTRNGFVPVEGYRYEAVAGERTKISWMIALIGRDKQRFAFVVQGVVMRKYEEISISQLAWLAQYHCSAFAKGLLHVQFRDNTVIRGVA